MKDYGVLADEVRSSAVGEPSRLHRLTDEFGRIEFAPLFPCELRLSVSPPERGWSYALQMPTKVAPGLSTDLTIAVLVVEGELTVQETGSAQALAHRHIRLSPKGGGLVVQAVLNEQGRVRLSLPTGKYHVQDGGDGEGIYMPTGEGTPLDWTALGPVPASVEVVKAKPMTMPSNH